MGFYEDRVLLHLVTVAMSTKGMRDERRRCLEPLSGDVLDIERLENGYREGAPKFGGYLYRGVAKRPIS